MLQRRTGGSARRVALCAGSPFWMGLAGRTPGVQWARASRAPGPLPTEGGISAGLTEKRGETATWAGPWGWVLFRHRALGPGGRPARVC